jgi:phosphatidylserine/phosphatidylglycerophosphate/cardiolipin synthase-like enzyme
VLSVERSASPLFLAPLEASAWTPFSAFSAFSTTVASLAATLTLGLGLAVGLASGLVFAAGLSGCLPNTEQVEQPLSKEDVSDLGKADWLVDYCEINGWYGDGECDTFCPQMDEDCAQNSCVAAGGTCVEDPAAECDRGYVGEARFYSCGALNTAVCCLPYPDVATTAVLEIYPLDIWARPLPADDAEIWVTLDGEVVNLVGYPQILVPLNDMAAYEVVVEAPGYETLAFAVNYDGSGSMDGVEVIGGPAAAGHGLTVSRDMRTIGGRQLPVTTLYLGLHHKWYSAQGRPPRAGNTLDLFLSGETAWAAVYDEIAQASDSVLISTWWWDSEFELIRDPHTHHTIDRNERWSNTILGVLLASPAYKRILVGEFWGEHDILDWMTNDSTLSFYAETPDDDFEFMGQGNPTDGQFRFRVDPVYFDERVLIAFPGVADRAFAPDAPIPSVVPEHDVDLSDWPVNYDFQMASYHQKLVVADHDVAFVGGMNLKDVDWDSAAHRVFEHRRMKFNATEAQRQAVIAKTRQPDLDPRKDYMLRLEGPASQDVADVFHLRYAHLLEQGARYAENSSDFVVVRNIAPRPDGSTVQVTTTLPLPFWEHSIAETWFNAVAQAEQYIFIEDQYWRVPMLVDAIVARMSEVPDLKLLVVTMPISEWTNPGCEWTHKTHNRLKSLFPDRYRTYQLRSFDSVVTWGWEETECRFADIYNHSKLLIVDDVFMSVGSCNKNNRGLVYEAELNIAVLDSAWVQAQRRRIFANMLPEATPPTDEVAVWWEQFAQAAEWNDAVYEAWDLEGGDLDLGQDGDLDPLPLEFIPEGFVYTVDFRDADECLIESVSPDLF